jgi:hypothetical protein
MIPGSRLISLASDGESRRGAALAQLTQKKSLPKSSNIFHLLGHLKLFNTLVGDDDLTCDKDYKHVFKRLRNLLLRDKGTIINGIQITPSVLSWHLRADGMPAHKINYLLNPADKQDVTLVFTLLNAIWSLRSPEPTDRPGFAAAREALKTLGSLFRHLMLPYVQVTMSLHHQLVNLSAASHLATFLYTAYSGGKRFFPKILYDDIQIMIKNVYFCVAKTKVDHPDARFWTILLGTDRLEISFGIYRTMIGNDANADILQLANRISSVTEVSRILGEHPEWDRGPRRLKLPTFDENEDVTPKADHINPASWTGDVRVSQVLPVTCWNEGRRLIENSHKNARNVFTKMEEDGVDVLSPFAVRPEDDRSDGVGEESDDEENETLVTQQESPSQDAASTEDLDLEDQVAIEESQANPISFKPFVEVQGKPVYKARILREYFKFKTNSSSTDRLKRVAGLSRFAITPNASSDILDFDSVFGGQTLFINEPVATLVKCNDLIFLALGQVTKIAVDVRSVPQIALELVAEKTVSLSIQLLRLAYLDPSSNPAGADWEWTRKLDTTHKLPGRLVETINPTVSTQTAGKPTYLFRSEELRLLAASLFARLSSGDDLVLPVVNQSEYFPYRASGACRLFDILSRPNHNAGRAAFLCESDHGDRQLHDLDTCPKCRPAYEWDRTQGQRILEHVGTHILFDSTISHLSETCGFCLQSGSTCVFYLRKGRGSGSGPQVDLIRSRCLNLVKFSYQSASTSTDSAPCSNVPIPCPLCPAKDPAIWRYNMKTHFHNHHPTAPWVTYEAQFKISDAEKAGMELLWRKKPRMGKKKARTHRTALAISEAHSSRLIIR